MQRERERHKKGRETERAEDKKAERQTDMIYMRKGWLKKPKDRERYRDRVR